MDALFFTVEERQRWGKEYMTLYPEMAQAAIDTADQLYMNHIFRWQDMDIDMGSPVNWLHNPTGDKEFTWVMNRFRHLQSLGIAYVCTGKELYAAKAIEHISGWISSQPCPRDLPAEELTYFQRPGPWRLLETGLRLRQWVYAYHFFHGAPSWTIELETRFFHSIKEHAWFLSTYMGSIEINHSIMHMIGLLSAGLTFASWEESEHWRDTASARLEDCIRVQLLTDGVHTELTPHYHMVSLELFTDCAIMMERKGFRFSEKYEQALYRMVRFSRCMTRQNGYMAPFADSFAVIKPDVNAAALFFNRPDWLLPDQEHEQFWSVGPDRLAALTVASREPGLALLDEKLPIVFSAAGYYVLGDGEQKLIFDTAALGGPHGHADALSFEWCAFGEALFVDPGTYTYMETPWRRYFKSTSAHNTVLVDGQDQTPYLRTQRWGQPETQVKLIAWDPEQQLLCAEHNGYTRFRDGIMHRRAIWYLPSGEWVIYDRLKGAGGHTYQHRLHSRLLDWKIHNMSGDVTKFYVCGSCLQGTESKMGCEVLMFGPNSMEFDIEDGWESVKPLKFEPLKVLQGLLTTDDEAWFITVLKPFREKIAMEPHAWSLDRDDLNRPVLLFKYADGIQRFICPDE
jgi:hypothetical protein